MMFISPFRNQNLYVIYPAALEVHYTPAAAHTCFIVWYESGATKSGRFQDFSRQLVAAASYWYSDTRGRSAPQLRFSIRRRTTSYEYCTSRGTGTTQRALVPVLVRTSTRTGRQSLRAESECA